MKRLSLLLGASAFGLWLVSAAQVNDDVYVYEQSSPAADCQWSGLDCGTANAACLAFEPPRVKCEPGSVGDPDGDGCGCWVLTLNE